MLLPNYINEIVSAGGVSRDCKALRIGVVKSATTERSKKRSVLHEEMVDLHVMIDPSMNVKESHDLSHAIDRRLNEKLGGNVQTVIHMEPDQEEEYAESR